MLAKNKPNDMEKQGLILKDLQTIIHIVNILLLNIIYKYPR